MKAVNALIVNADLKNEHCLQMPIELEIAGGSGVVFGGICMGHEEKSNDENENYAAHYICKVFNVVGVSSLKNMKGKPVRAIFQNEGGLGDLCIGIQNFLDFSNYFIPGNREITIKDLEDIMEDQAWKLDYKKK